MTQINLLPWREQGRQIKKVLFGIILAGCVVASFFFVIFAHFYLHYENDVQVERNNYLQSMIDQTNTQIGALKLKVKVRDKIVAELKLIVNLRDKSYAAVSLLNLLIQSVPSSVLIDRVSRTGSVFTIEGVADSDLATTLFMRSINSVKGFKQPVLNVIRSVKGPAQNANQEIHFQLKVEPQD
jgi:type IV pilus assembly protein PilN